MKINKKSLNAINEVMTQYGNLEESLGIDSIQSERFMRDYRVGAKIGVAEMNENNHGWDGYFNNGVPSCGLFISNDLIWLFIFIAKFLFS